MVFTFFFCKPFTYFRHLACTNTVTNIGYVFTTFGRSEDTLPLSTILQFTSVFSRSSDHANKVQCTRNLYYVSFCSITSQYVDRQVITHTCTELCCNQSGLVGVGMKL
jgi:hypothetical protein